VLQDLPFQSERERFCESSRGVAIMASSTTEQREQGERNERCIEEKGEIDGPRPGSGARNFAGCTLVATEWT